MVPGFKKKMKKKRVLPEYISCQPKKYYHFDIVRPILKVR